MEFIDGETVEARIRRQGPLEPVETLKIGLQVTRALVVAAKQQLVHRDLKPSNLMLVSQEGEQVVKVIDFGLAKGPRDAGDDSSALTVAGFVGTPHFASPEQIEEEEVDIRSDIYSLGVTLFFMLTGQSPFSGSAGQVMSQQLYKPLPIEPLAKLPRFVVSLLQHMMEKDRNNRPQTPQDLQTAMIACLEEMGTARYPASESAVAFETPDRYSTSGQPLGVGVVLAQSYKLIEELAESPMGRSYLADDLAHKRRVRLMILSPEFLSDGRRLTALEEAIRLARAWPHPLLREIHPLETVTDYTFLAQEHITGPSMLDILRARSVLTAPEVVRLVSLLAPLVDHANRHRVQHIDITLSGIHLIDRASSSVGVRPDPLRRLLTSCELLKPKVDAINFLSLPSNVETWSSPATVTPGASGCGSHESCIRLLSMLAYELLGGPRTRLEATGQLSPLAALTQEGNAVLRQGVADEFPSAEEFSRQLAAATSIATSAPDVSGVTRQPPQTQDSRIPPPQARVPVSDQRKPLTGKWPWILILCPLVLLGIGFYLLNLFRGSQEIPSLSIRTEPAGASILLDGKAPESAASNFAHVPFGTHRLSATLPDYYPIREEIQIRKGMAPEIRLQLKPVQEIAALSIRTEPPGAAILLDGKPPQEPANTFTDVPFGAHQLTATLADYEPP
jgi:serine/threonine protein kinase